MSEDPECIFCKIIAGDVPSECVFQDDHAVAFLDINPIAPGHTLLVPRKHCEGLLDAPADVLHAVIERAPRVARAVMKATEAEGFNLIQFNGSCAGQEVFHLHFHIIPRRPGDGVSFAWKQGSYGEGEMVALGGRIREAMGE
ncbi:MAG: HIT family protein [Candidatus Brocadiia bacterium]